MKITKKRVETISYTIELDSYRTIQLADVLGAAIRRHNEVVIQAATQAEVGVTNRFSREFLSPQELSVAQCLLAQLREQINSPA